MAQAHSIGGELCGVESSWSAPWRHRSRRALSHPFERRAWLPDSAAPGPALTGDAAHGGPAREGVKGKRDQVQLVPFLMQGLGWLRLVGWTGLSHIVRLYQHFERVYAIICCHTVFCP